MTITGLGLTGITGIKFGGTPANLSTLTYGLGGAITIASPAEAAGSVNVVVRRRSERPRSRPPTSLITSPWRSVP